jgi:uncharacterized protein
MTALSDPAPTPRLYAVPIEGRWLVWAPQVRMAAVVNRSAVTQLAKGLAGDIGGLSGDLRDLWDAFTRQPSPEEGREHTVGKLVILPTRACNMRCVYCDFSAATAAPTVLDPVLACRLIDYAVAQLYNRGQRTLRVHLFGGEPLVARECTETVVHYARALCARTGLMPWFELTTNGLFDSAVVPFIGDYIDSVVVSLDGTLDLHDFNRRRRDGSGTYAQIAANIRRLASFPVELCLRTCVTNRSADVMAELAAGFCAEFTPDVLSFEMLAENSCGREAGLSAPDPYAFAAGVLAAEAFASRQGVRVVHGPSELAGPRTSSCPLGQGTLMLAPDGRLTACYLDPGRWTERGLDLIVGHVDALTGVSVDHEKQASVVELVRSKPRCSRCFCRHTCAGGCHVDQTPPGCSREYDNRCRAIRVITAGRLLRSLGIQEDANALANEPSAMQEVANHPDDRLFQWTQS